MTSVAEERETTEADRLPVDVETISANVDLAWDMSLSTSTREVIDLRTSQLIGYLIQLQGQPLGEDQDPDALRLLRIVGRHLDPVDRPTETTFAAFGFMRDTAVFVKALLALYQKANPSQ
ncbi:hypothetical protein ACR6C2_17045 [Streptomyces sp. INA 01156]